MKDEKEFTPKDYPANVHEVRELNPSLVEYRLQLLEIVTEKHSKQISMLLRVAYIIFGIILAFELFPTLQFLIQNMANQK